MTEQYPKSEQTDKKVLLKPKEKDETIPPEKILLVSANSSTVDKMLFLAESFKLNVKMLRIG